MADERNGNFNLKTLAFFAVSVGAIASPFIALGAYKVRLENIEKKAYAQEENNKGFEASLSSLNLARAKHEALIPIIQEDVRSIKEGMRDANRKADQILMALKR